MTPPIIGLMVTTVPPTKTLPLYDRLIPGGVEAFLADARGNGESFPAIVARLKTDFDIDISVQTVANWCRQFKITKADAS